VSKLINILGGKQVRPGGKQLADLSEGGSEFLESPAEAFRLFLTAHSVFFVQKSEQLSKPELGKHGGDFAKSGNTVRLREILFALRSICRGSFVSFLFAGRDRVDQDHGAGRIVAYPVGHVSKEEFAASGHTCVADNQHVDAVFLGRAH
jgi:hypothetical protein